MSQASVVGTSRDRAFTRRRPSVRLARTALALMIVGLVVLKATAADEPRAEGAATSVNVIGEEYLRLLSEDSLFLRLKRGLVVDRMPDLSPARAEARLARVQALLSRLERLPEASLVGEERWSHAMLRRKLRHEVEAHRHYWLGFTVTPYASPLGPVHQAFRALPLATPEDAGRYLALLDSTRASSASFVPACAGRPSAGSESHGRS